MDFKLLVQIFAVPAIVAIVNLIYARGQDKKSEELVLERLKNIEINLNAKIDQHISDDDKSRLEDKASLAESRQNSRNDYEKEKTEFWGQIKILRDDNHKKDEMFYKHERESGDYRLAVEKQFGSVLLQLSDTNGKFSEFNGKLDAIMTSMDEFKEEFRDFKNRT